MDNRRTLLAVDSHHDSWDDTVALQTNAIYLEEMKTEPSTDSISLRPKVKSGETIAQAAVAACLDRALNYCLTLVLLSASLLPGWASAEVITGKDAQTGLRTWEWKQAGISVQLVQRLPDQTRAFFQGRGFSSADADIIGRACVFQTIFRNDGKQHLTYDLNDWRITYQGRDLPLLTKERWNERWESGAVSKAARIAFRWSFLPTHQTFEPGDYNWGMTSFGLPPGESFDLALVLTADGKIITGRIPGIVCTEDKP